MEVEGDYLSIVVLQFKHFKERAEEAIDQLTDEELHWKPNEESNSIAIIMKHISGNMHSRWDEFLISDGEKANRKRDGEFVDDFLTRAEILQNWQDGWELLFKTIENLLVDDLHKVVTLRQQPISVLKAIQIEIAHISYHLGQILYIGKQIKDKQWKILSIPKNSR